ncbi:hypothetical protein ACLB2K_000420 [Fragaria x ananassa]
MGKKRKLGQLEAAQPQPAEPKKQKPEPVVISVDDAGTPLESAKQIVLIQPEVLPNPNEVPVKPAEQVFTNPPVPEIETEAAEPPPPKKRKKPKKQKQNPFDICVDVAGKASEPSKEIGLIQGKPPELPPPNLTVGVESGAELSSNPAEIEAKPAELPPPNPVAKGEVKSEEARMNPEPNVEAKTEEVTVKKKKNKKQKLRELMEMQMMQSAVTTQCGDDVEKNCEAKIIEEDEPPKKRKKNKRQKLRELMEMQGTVTACVDDVEKNGEAKLNEVMQKPGPVVTEMKGAEGKVIADNVEGKMNGGEVDMQSRVATQCVDVEENGEAKINEEHGPVKKKKKKNKKQKLRELMEMQGTVTSCIDDVEKSGEVKINGLLPVPPMTQTVREVEMQSTVATQCGDVEKNDEAKINEEDGPVKKKKKKKKKNKKQKLRELMEMQGTVTSCVDDVEKSGEVKINGLLPVPPMTQTVREVEMQSTMATQCGDVEKNGEAKINEDGPVKKKKKKQPQKLRNLLLKPVQVVAVVKGSNETVTVFVGVENNVKRKIDEAGVVAKLLAMHGLTMAVGEVENKKRKRKENKMENTDITSVDVGKNDEVVTMPGLPQTIEEVETKKRRRKEDKEVGSTNSCVDAGKNVELLLNPVPNVKGKPKVLTASQELRIRMKKRRKAARRREKWRMKCRITMCDDDAGKFVEAKTSEEHKEDNKITNAMLILKHMEWRKKQLVLGLQRKAVAEKRKEKKSTEETVEEKNKESTNEKVEEQIIEYLQVCVICRGKGHIISTCPLLNQTQTNNKKSGNKLPECCQPLQHAELKNGEAEKLLDCPPEDTLVKDKSSDCKEGKSAVKNGEAEKLLGCPPMDTLMKEETSGVKGDIVMKDESIVKVDCASHPEECYVKPTIGQGPEAVNPVA